LSFYVHTLIFLTLKNNPLYNISLLQIQECLPQPSFRASWYINYVINHWLLYFWHPNNRRPTIIICWTKICALRFFFGYLRLLMLVLFNLQELGHFKENCFLSNKHFQQDLSPLYLAHINTGIWYICWYFPATKIIPAPMFIKFQTFFHQLLFFRPLLLLGCWY